MFNTVLKTVAFAASIASVGLAGVAMTVSQARAGQGSITVTYKDDVSTLDPAIGYDWQNWSMIKSLFDGLMDYEPGTTTLKPNLATGYTVSEDGLTYTFTLRKGVKFHNGREFKASDVKYTLERVVNPKTQSPGTGFYATIKGFEEESSGKTDRLSGIEIVDDYTVKFTLNRPDATFLHKMALNFAHIVPKEAVEKWGQDFGRHPVGTGAFKLEEWTLGQRLVFKANPDYHIADVPKLDSIIFEVGQEPIVALLRLQRGEVDIAGDGIPPAKFLEVMHDPQYKDLVVSGDQLHTGYIALNTRIPPFDDLKVRKAVNMAIDKERIVRVINGRAEPANQPLPPLMPGYNKDYTGYPYDPKIARALLAEAGYGDGVETTLFVANTDPQPRIAQAIQQDLAAIGMTVDIRSLAQANVIAAGGEADQAPMIWSGGMAWIADYPDPSNFYGPILSCGSAVPGGWNWSWYCNKELDAEASKADAMADPSRAETRIDMWRHIFTAIMADAPWVPVFNEKRYTIRSPRLGADDALFVDPVHIPVNYNSIAVK